MKILFVAEQLYFPQLYGGVQTSTDQLCHALIKRGHSVALLVELMPGGLFAWHCRMKMQINKRLFGQSVSRDTSYGYPVWRTWFSKDAVEYVANKESPDLIVVMTGKIVPIALAAKRTNIPVLAQLHDVALDKQDGDFRDICSLPCVANSGFTAETYQRAYGVKPSVIYPFILPSKYKTKTSNEVITFINPHPRKGLNIALEIARRCSDIPFLFVEGWTLSPQQRTDLTTKLSTLSNVTLIKSLDDMRKIYAKSKILLAPSICEEAYGRVATEAQISGIPVIASKRGAFPEVIGSGGILIDPDGPIDPWVQAVQRLWSDNSYYIDLSLAALANTQRPEMELSYQIDAHERALLNACSGQAITN